MVVLLGHTHQSLFRYHLRVEDVSLDWVPEMRGHKYNRELTWFGFVWLTL